MPTKDKDTGLPAKYLPKGLSEGDRKRQLKSIKEGTDRPKVKSFKSKPSKWTQLAKEYFGKSPTLDEMATELKRKGASASVKEGLKQILNKGRGAYYSSGSRPNQTAESWAKARLYAVLFGSAPARRVDKSIVDEYNIPLLSK